MLEEDQGVGYLDLAELKRYLSTLDPPQAAELEQTVLEHPQVEVVSDGGRQLLRGRGDFMRELVYLATAPADPSSILSHPSASNEESCLASSLQLGPTPRHISHLHRPNITPHNFLGFIDSVLSFKARGRFLFEVTFETEGQP